MLKSNVGDGDRPDWYRGLKSKKFGDYFGSLSSLTKDGETYLTHDHLYIVHLGQNGKVTVSRNACMHAGAPLLNTPGVQDASHLKCPVHMWTYKPTGELIAAPHFDRSACAHIKLKEIDFGVWNGYVLGYPQEELDRGSLKTFGRELGLPLHCFDPREFEYECEEERELPYPRALMKINYFDGYHVSLCHQKTFDAVADCDTYRWEFGKEFGKIGRPNYSIQVVRARKDVRKHMHRLMNKYGCPETDLGWAHFHEWLKEVMPNVERPLDPSIFAVWAAVYGNGYLMLELYEGGLFLAVSYLVTLDGDESGEKNLNLVEYYIHKSVPHEHRKDAMRKFRFAYGQSADEDDAICPKLHSAHRLGNMDFNRITHEDLEAGDAHWREWALRTFFVK
jgi:choline monooxygenase